MLVHNKANSHTLTKPPSSKKGPALPAPIIQESGLGVERGGVAKLNLQALFLKFQLLNLWSIQTSFKWPWSMANIIAAIDYNKSGEKYTEMQPEYKHGTRWFSRQPECKWLFYPHTNKILLCNVKYFKQLFAQICLNLDENDREDQLDKKCQSPRRTYSEYKCHKRKAQGLQTTCTTNKSQSSQCSATCSAKNVDTMQDPKESFPSQKRQATELQDLFDQIHAEQLLIEPVEKYQEEKDQKVNKPSSFYGHMSGGFHGICKEERYPG